jgi:hypothetical protein
MWLNRQNGQHQASRSHPTIQGVTLEEWSDLPTDAVIVEQEAHGG